MSKEAMKLALEALEAGEYYIDDLEAIVYAADDLGTHEDRAKMQAAITVLRLEIDALNMASKPALAEQPAQQEPVATLFGSLPVYDTSLPAQRTWVGLTDEERDAIIGATDLSGTYYYDDLYAVILLAEGKLKEKNA